MMKGFQAIFLVLGCAVALTGSGPALSFDLGLYAEVEARVAQGRVRQAEMLIEAELMVSRSLPLDDRLDLLDALAELQAQEGKHADRGDTLADKAALLADAYGADYPDLAPVHTRAGDAFMTGDAPERAVESYRAALQLDEIYLACDNAALGESYRRYAEALAASGDTVAGIEARAWANDPLARCGIVVAEPAPEPAPEPVPETAREPQTPSLPSGPKRPGAARHAALTSPVPTQTPPPPAPASPIAAPAEVTRSEPLPFVIAPPTGRSVSASGSPSEAGFATIRLFYGTDRAPSGSLRPSAFYGPERGPLDYGSVDVAVPRSHKPGQAEVPSLLRFQWADNATHQVAITDLARLDEPAFFEAIASDLTGRDRDEVLLFIHGFNTTFAEAARHTAGLAYDLNFEGLPLFYAWPSRGTARGYAADAVTVQVSARRLLGFLEGVVDRAGAGQTHLIAHAMGARALTGALELYAARHPQAEQVFGQVIFAAPDIDAELFALQARAMHRLATRVTLYTNSTDPALTAIRGRNGDAPRAGGDGAPPVVSPDFDTIDMSDLGAEFLDHANTLADMLWLLWQNPSPGDRCGMAEADADEAVDDGAYWVFGHEACDAQALLPAITLARRLGIDALAQVAVARANAMETAADGQGGTVELKALEAALADILRP